MTGPTYMLAGNDKQQNAAQADLKQQNYTLFPYRFKISAPLTLATSYDDKQTMPNEMAIFYQTFFADIYLSFLFFFIQSLFVIDNF